MDNHKTPKEKVLEKYPNAYATYGFALFSKKKEWRIEDGTGKQLASRAGSENAAWGFASNYITANML